MWPVSTGRALWRIHTQPAAAAPPAWQGTLQRHATSQGRRTRPARAARPPLARCSARRRSLRLRWRRGPARSRPRKGDRGPRAAPCAAADRRGTGADRPEARALAVRAPAGLASPGSSSAGRRGGGSCSARGRGHESAPMARRARPAHPVRSRSPSWVQRGARGDPWMRTSEALTGGSAQPPRPRMSLPGGRPYPWG